MYEFNKKEIRKNFKQTKYGNDINRWLYISFFITIVYVIVCAILCILISGLDVQLNSFNKSLLMLLKGLTVISIIVMCYFDGKRDGAIEQYKKNLYKN